MKKINLLFALPVLCICFSMNSYGQKPGKHPPGQNIEIAMTQLSDADWQAKLSAGGSSVAKTGTCNDPSNYQTTQVQFRTANFSFNLSNSDAAVAQSRVQVFGPNSAYAQWDISGNYANVLYSGTFINLNPSTQYSWIARVTCFNSAGTQIGVSTDANQVFITKTCNQVSNPTAAVTGNSVTISWAGGGGISEQSLQRRLNGTTAWTPSALTFSTSKTITNLGNGLYNLQITGRCKSDLSPFPVYQLPTIAGPNFAIQPPPPGGLTVNAVGYTSARFAWNAVAGATSYNVGYKLLSATAWTSLGSTTNTSYTFPVGMLQMGQSYDVRVQSVSGGVTSAFARTASIPSLTTLNCNAIPSPQPATAIGFNRVTLSWTGGTGLYNLQYKRYGATTWTNIQVTGTSYTLTGLVMGAIYNWQVQSICNNSPIAGDVTTSAFASGANGQFYTLFASAPASVHNASYGSFSGVTPRWSAVPYAINYDLIYRVKGTTAWTYVNDIAGLTGPTIPGAQGTVFEVQVKASCASSVDAAESAYSPITEMSVYICGAAYGGSVSNITVSSASLFCLFSISYGKGAAYDFRYKKTTDATWVESYNVPYVFVPDPLREQCYTCEPYDDLHGATLNIGGLIAGTQYQWQVRTNCGSGVYSNWIDKGTFNTLATACPGVISSASVAFFEDGCFGISGPNLFWTAVPGATQYEIKKTCGTGPSIFTNGTSYNTVPSGAGDVIGIRVSACTGGTGPGAWRYISIAGHNVQYDDDPEYCGASWWYTLPIGANYNCGNNTVFRSADVAGASEEPPFVTQKPVINNVGRKSGLHLAPNPATKEIALNYNSDAARVAEVTITTLTGKPVLKNKITLVKGQNSSRISLGGVVAGQYLLTLRMGNKLITEKLSVIN